MTPPAPTTRKNAARRVRAAVARSQGKRHEPFVTARPELPMLDPNSAWYPFKIGARVRACSLEGYDDIIASKVRGRIGLMSDLQSNSARPVVVFPAVGQRPAYRWVPNQPSDLELVAP